MDGADHLVRGVANAQLCSPDRRDPRNRCDGLLLLRGRDRIARPDSTAEQPSADTAPARRNPGAGRVPRHANQVATRRTASASPAGGPGARSSRRPDVCTSSGCCCSRHRCPLHPTRSLHLARADARHRRVGLVESTHRESPPERSPCWWSRSARPHPARARTRAGRNRVRWSRSTPTGRSVQSRRTESRSGRPERFGSLGLAGGAWVTRATGIGFRWRSGSPSAGPLCPGRRARGSLRRRRPSPKPPSSCRRWLRVASLVAVGRDWRSFVGPFLGALLILVTDAPLPLLNVVAGVVYAIAMPFVALVTSYVYFDARTRVELEPVDDPDELRRRFSLSVWPPRRAAEPCWQRRSPRRAASRRHPSRRRAGTRAARQVTRTRLQGR